MASQRRNPFARPGREVTIRIDSGKTIRVFTNDLDSPAEVIADLYKQRWQIELFFKWIRQNLQITRFIGHTDNAVRIQIVTGLIAYLLIRLIHAAQNTAQPASALLRLISHHLFERRSLATLLHPPRRPRQPRLKQGTVF
jgi:IS4 transposase